MFIFASMHVEQNFYHSKLSAVRKPFLNGFEINKTFFLDITGSKFSYPFVLTCSCPSGPKLWTISITNRIITDRSTGGEIICQPLLEQCI